MHAHARYLPSHAGYDKASVGWVSQFQADLDFSIEVAGIHKIAVDASGTFPLLG
jgi:hypothetical protein